MPRKGTYSERVDKELDTELQVKELANLKRQVEELKIKLLSSEKERETLLGMCEALQQEQKVFHYQKKGHSVSLESGKKDSWICSYFFAWFFSQQYNTVKRLN